MSLARALLAALIAGCGSDIKVTQSALCDGAQQPSEDAVDEPFDRDGDGYFDAGNPDCQETYDASRLDCNDADANIYPGNEETACNGQDDDCDEATVDDADVDGDRFMACEECDDDNPSVNPAQQEVSCNGVDDDCDESTPDGDDIDNDGYDACSDCDDLQPDINPGATEVACNGYDDDCNEFTTDGDDYDGDTFTSCDDCDDTDENINPGHDEECDNGLDDDCDAEIDEVCDSDYTGSWDLDDDVVYSCTFGLVSIDFDSVFIEDEYPDITVAASGSGSQPGTMRGSFSSATSWSADRTISGSCDEIYEISGTFTDENTFEATLTASFRGGGACFDCSNQSWTFTGTR